jgi:hypothetical protein
MLTGSAGSFAAGTGAAGLGEATLGADATLGGAFRNAESSVVVELPSEVTAKADNDCLPAVLRSR